MIYSPGNQIKEEEIGRAKSTEAKFWRTGIRLDNQVYGITWFATKNWVQECGLDSSDPEQ